MSTLKGLLSDPKDRRFVIVAVACAPLSILLGMVHPVFAFLAIAPAALIAYMLCGMISRIVFGKDFVFVSKFGLNTPEENLAIRWSDYALTLLCSLLAVLGMFLAGEIVDRMRGEDFWKWERGRDGEGGRESPVGAVSLRNGGAQHDVVDDIAALRTRENAQVNRLGTQ